ncbi:hypothetical protein BDI4_300057 [Burkholderia diffusa]|nr:hypothetical protein BDI4_300057 [Burkholderia diffusa]
MENMHSLCLCCLSLLFDKGQF